MQKTYDFKTTEPKLQKRWQDLKIHHFDPASEKPIYSIDVPPRYASGTLHIGHAMHYTHIDFAARYRRMRGYNVFNPLCFDVNGMPIEVNVEKKYGIAMRSHDRQDFIKLCREFADANIQTMIDQFTQLGCCYDPSIYYRTDAEYYRRITQLSFLEMYRNDLIYKGEFPVNWCPRCGTAMAHAEIEYSARETALNHILFDVVGEEECVIIATTRPELLCTCQLVAVHPDKDETKHLIGKTLRTPLFGREVTVVADDVVDPQFGTGIVMICTIGDKEDLRWVYKYNLEFQIAISDDGTMNERCGTYEGMKAEDAKKAIIADLDAQGVLVKQDTLEQNVGTCWRCHTPTEILVKKQWFLKILQFKDMILTASDKLSWNPDFMKSRLSDWVDTLAWDWVVSRQRYFATPIPLWECAECGEVVLATDVQCYVDPTIDAPPVDGCPKCGGALHGCEDVFDTWMDSSVSPLYNTFWQRDDALFKKLYPMSMRPQAHEIVRTWLFYTMLRCNLITGGNPFESTMIDGFMMGPDGRPMHTSWGNVVDPLEVLEKHGADAMRYFSATCALGIDNAFRWKDVTRGVKLLQKLWNIEKFIGTMIQETSADDLVIDEAALHTVDRWIISKMSRMIADVTGYMDAFQFEKAIRAIEYFMWHDVADNYLELVKYRLYERDDGAARAVLYTIGLTILKVFAPFMSHIADEAYLTFFAEKDGAESVHVSAWPVPLFVDDAAEATGDIVKDVVAELRRWKSENGMALNTAIAYVDVIADDDALRTALEQEKEEIARTAHVETLGIAASADGFETVVGAVKPVHAKIGPEFKRNAKAVITALAAADPAAVAAAVDRGDAIQLSLPSGDNVALPPEYVTVEKVLRAHGRDADALVVGAVTLILTK